MGEKNSREYDQLRGTDEGKRRRASGGQGELAFEALLTSGLSTQLAVVLHSGLSQPEAWWAGAGGPSTEETNISNSLC